ncbi:MAG: DNA internalization-related competence protein ComEC/Rec2 [Bacillota bacterium]|nr:DNA internalization-related competence protein ComEC/Rec2 [Bacillota bacterium]
MRRPVVFIALFFMGMIFVLDSFFGVKLYDEGKLPGHDGETLAISGTVLSYTEKADDHIQMIVRASRFKREGVEEALDAPEKIFVNIYRESYDTRKTWSAGIMPGREVSVTGQISIPEPARNPGTFDYRKYLRTRQIYTLMKGVTGSFRTGQVKDRLRHTAARLRKRFLITLEEYTDEDTSALADAMLFGDKSGLDEEQYEKFRKNGTAHILAVSGLHIGAIYGLVLLLWPGRKRWAFALFTAFFFIFYCFLADFSPSVVRAVIMIILHLIAKLFYRRYDIMTGAALTSIIVLCHCPMQLYNTGFQMSFLAVAVISALAPLTGKGLTGKCAFMLLFQSVMLPYTVYTFNYASLSAFIINPVVILIAGIMVPTGVLMMLMTGFVAGMGTVIPGRIFSGCAGILTGINDAAYRPGTLCFDAASPALWMIFIFYAGFFILISEMFLIMKIRKRWRAILYVTVILVFITVGAGNAADGSFRDAEIVFVDVGQGDCMHMKVKGEGFFAGERNYLFDGGGSVRYDTGKKTLKPYLLKNGVSHIDGAFVTHLHTDHYKGICELAGEGMVDRLFVYEGNRLREKEICEETGLDAGQITYLCAGQKVKAGSRAEIKILWPERKTKEEYENLLENEEDENASSLIMRVEIGGVSVLVTGDMGEEGEASLLSADDPQNSALDADILKVGHHGSKTSSSGLFLDRVSPEAAVIQVGKNNNYGHPSPETLQRLKERNIPVFRNDLQGAVAVNMEDGKISGYRTVIRSESP